MTDETTKLLDDITLQEWAEWEWTDCTAECEEKRTYSKGKQRSPAEFMAARQEFLEYLKRRENGLERALA